jgi:N-acyl-D-aspartate/D-glutamate deacylase
MRLALLLLGGILSAQTYDIVLSNGRVIDPESNLDAIRNVGINGSRIAAVSTTKLQGKTTIDATGLVIAPGFIDLHSHGQDDENYRYKARDGVTTALELEVGVNPVKPWYSAREGKSLINFGASSGHIPSRIAVMHDPGPFLPSGPAAHRKATTTEIHDTEELIRKGLDDHALGVGLGIAYVPSATHPEILSTIRIAADRKVPVFVHIRTPGAMEPTPVTASIEEMIACAAITGASIHLVHITSMAAGQTGLALEMLRGARAHGIDITTEAYPYTAGQTRSIPPSSMKSGRSNSGSLIRICNGSPPASASHRNPLRSIASKVAW